MLLVILSIFLRKQPIFPIFLIQSLKPKVLKRLASGPSAKKELSRYHNPLLFQWLGVWSDPRSMHKEWTPCAEDS